MSLDLLLEAILFYKTSPQTKKELVGLLKISSEELETAIDVLQNRLKNGAIRLLNTGEELQLVTAPELSEFINTLQKQELESNLSKSSLEVLAIVIYRGPVTKTEIDNIRGVNSTYAIRNLLTRGLIIKQTKKSNAYFLVTAKLLRYMGLTNKEQIPEFETFKKSLSEFENEHSVKPNK